MNIVVNITLPIPLTIKSSGQSKLLNDKRLLLRVPGTIEKDELITLREIIKNFGHMANTKDTSKEWDGNNYGR